MCEQAMPEPQGGELQLCADRKDQQQQATGQNLRLQLPEEIQQEDGEREEGAR
jgi:hypothetical protein